MPEPLTLTLCIAPDPIFSQVARPVEAITPDILAEIDAMFDVLYAEQGIGLGANMVGLTKQIIVVDLQMSGVKTPLAMINPTVTAESPETETAEEASLSFPGISAKITRPEEISLTYLDRDGNTRTLDASGLLARVIQHEMDYLRGETFLDHLSPVKRKMLLKKMSKVQARNQRH